MTQSGIWSARQAAFKRALARGNAAQFERVEAVDQLVNSATPVDDSLMLATTNGFFAWDGHNPPQLLPDTPINASAFIRLQAQPDTWAALDTATV